jgi:ribosome-associated toxin RatA of RatAB toxin-antitoxin module
MTHVSVTKIIDHNAQQVWEVLSDFPSIYKFHSGIDSVDLLSENARDIGATRRCNFYGSGHAVEKIVDWKEDRFLTLDIIGGTLPFNHARASFAVRPTTTDKAEVTFEIDFEAKYGIIGKIMEKLAMRLVMKNAFKNMIDGLDTHLRTGSIIGKGGKEIAA